jgi:glycosyltransferase involved in cell wall biosynthesis
VKKAATKSPNRRSRNPLVSIIIPVWNGAKTVGRMITQVLEQPMRDFELIVVNDGSTDDTAGVLHKFAKTDKRMNVITQTNGGASSARNHGIKTARGKYVVFLDADDEIAPDFFTEMIDKIQTSSTELVVCGLEYMTIKNGKTVKTEDVYLSPLLNRGNDSWTDYIVRLVGFDGRLYNPCNKVYLNEIIQKHQLQFTPGLDLGEDLVFNLSYLKHIDNMEFIAKPLYRYHLDTAHGTYGKSALIYENFQKNLVDLKKFAGPHLSPKTQDLVGWVEHFWYYSFALNVYGSNLSLHDKLQKFQSVKFTANLQPAKTAKYIGRRLQTRERQLAYLSQHPFFLMLFLASTRIIKETRVFHKLWQNLTRKDTP